MIGIPRAAAVSAAQTKAARRFAVAAAGLIVFAAPTSALANRAITLSNAPSACGGTLTVSGTGFGAAKNKLSISVKAPLFYGFGGSSTSKTLTVVEHFSTAFTYWYHFNPPGPGCLVKVPVTVRVEGQGGNVETGTIDLPGKYCASFGPPECI